jgi:hypothetical protein
MKGDTYEQRLRCYQDIIDNFPTLSLFIWQLTPEPESTLQLVAINSSTEKLM